MDLSEYVDGLVHEPTQTDGPGLDLTVDAVSRVTGPGRVDFGGGELEPAETEAVPTRKRDPADDYGWWTLESGVYLLEYNETLAASAGRGLVLQTRRALRARGAFHPTLRLEGPGRPGPVPVTVGPSGVKLKENARVSTLLSV